MARMIAALIRHGAYHQLPDTPSAHQPFPLTEAGNEHARRSAERVAETAQQLGCAIEPVIDSSLLLRGWQTASVIAGELAGEYAIESFAGLAERGLGSAANLTVQQIESVLAADPRFPVPPPDWKSNSEYRLPLQGAESLLMAGERVAGHLRRRVYELDGSSHPRMKLFVGHGAAFRHAAYHIGVLRFEQIARLSMYYDQPVFIEFDGQHWLQVAGQWKRRDAASSPID